MTADLRGGGGSATSLLYNNLGVSWRLSPDSTVMGTQVHKHLPATRPEALRWAPATRWGNNRGHQLGRPFAVPWFVVGRTLADRSVCAGCVALSHEARVVGGGPLRELFGVHF